jgi:hypothetical protein
MTGAIGVRSRLPPVAGGGTGQRRGEAAGISRAVRVFKRCSKKGDVPPLWVSEARHAPYVHDRHRVDHGVRYSCGWRAVRGSAMRVLLRASAEAG